MGTPRGLTYSSYLKVPELLSLQEPLSEGPEHDELLFITIHQVYEIWFKQILHEATRLFTALEAADDGQILDTFKRILTIFKTLVAQVDVLETMTPISFNSFRSRLETASGFQSRQFRELEFLLGHKRRAVFVPYAADPEQTAILEERYAARTLYDAHLQYLLEKGYRVPKDLLERDVTQPIEAHEQLQEVLIETYRSDDPLVRGVCERMVDLDEAIQEWRYRHVKMVERTIGMKPGTGGSPGAAYLRSTLFKPLFPDLWAIRYRL